jgi:dihydroxy-acid dehydratase
MIELDVAGRRLHLDVSDEELARRKDARQARQPHAEQWLRHTYLSHVQQAKTGASFVS